MTKTKRKSTPKYKYGVVGEDEFTLITPREVDEVYETYSEAFDGAIEQLKDGCEQVSIVLCYHSCERWIEAGVGGCLTISVESSDWSGTEVMERQEAQDRQEAISRAFTNAVNR